MAKLKKIKEIFPFNFIYFDIYLNFNLITFINLTKKPKKR